jgi:hypothetical protein
MSKKLLLTIAVIVLVVLLTLFWWLRPAATPATVTAPITGNGELFPGGGDRVVPSANPSGQSNTLGTRPSDNTGGGLNTDNLNSPLYQISTKPISGVFKVGTNASSSIVYVEKATGHLYQVTADSRLPVRLTNTTLPKIYQVWGGGTKTEIRLLARYLKDGRMQNFAAGIPLPDTNNRGDSFIDQEQLPALRGRLWDDGVFNLAISPKQDQVFYLAAGANGSTGYLTDWAGNRPSSIFTSPLTEWASQWATSTTIALLSKPGAAVPGYLYWLNIKTKELTPVLSEVPGLGALTSPDLKNILYSALNNNRLTFGIYSTGTKVFKPLNITTLADKCVWNKTGQTAYCGAPRQLPTGEYPDAWYRGEISLADNIWKIDAATKQAELIFNPKLAGTGADLDATQLTLSDDQKTLYFVNKNDNQLWALNLTAGF